MATQSGLVLEGPNKPFTIVKDLPRPTPGSKQVVVKTLAVGIHPVDALQQHTGLLVTEWPAVIGSDCAGIVIETGPDCVRLKTGDYVYGCAPLGQNKFTPFQDSFLVQEDVFLKKSPNLTVEAASTIGAGILTACLCLLAGAELELPEKDAKTSEKGEWIIVLGGSGTVGQFAIQVAKLCGYKVLASCSTSKESVVIQNGAVATLNSRASVEEQVAQIKTITDGNFARMIDASAYGYDIMVKALETCSSASTKYLTSVDDWSTFKTPSTIKEYRAELGHLCRLDEPDGVEVTENVAHWIPSLQDHFAAGTLKPIEYELIDGVGWDKVIQGIQHMENGKSAKKIVVIPQRE